MTFTDTSLKDYQDANQISTRSGLSCAIVQKKLITMTELRDGVKHSIQHAKAAQKEELFWSRMLTGAKFIKATCNTILDTVGAFNPAVDKLSDASKFAQSYATNDTFGVLTQSAEKLAKEYGGDQGKAAMSEINKRAGLVKDAVEGKADGKTVTKYMINEKLNMAEKVAGELGKSKAGKVLKAAQAINNYAFDIYDLVESQGAAEKRGEGKSAAQKTLENLLDRFDRKIDDLERALHECEEPELKILLG